jgi:hypothetical protein
MRYPANPGQSTLAILGMHAAGAAANFFPALPTPRSSLESLADAPRNFAFSSSFRLLFPPGAV